MCVLLSTEIDVIDVACHTWLLVFFMEIQEFIENFAAQFDDTDEALFTADTTFKELDEWSSLTALSIIAMVDDECDVIIKGNDILNSDTIQDLFNVVVKKQKK